ncbi:hypothetical protein SAMN04489712_102533 [Thermomonospora echinospora]|uniref:Uncharacterized protein n=1 Tax=Thermomonospora echinospora TaxID=1992 RepID=A0A1H5VZI3_9ACTN|nr:hypothetical protein [Thermomonospora echinospora]SEF92682.1 hypothetical protein SAMN04489712_102533 [Thermomonospora echinospora]
MNRADLAIVISLISTSITATGVAWQLVLYRLSGARLQVRLIPAAIDIHETVVSGPDKGWSDLPLRGLQKWKVDVSKIQVTNIGRTAVSVSAMSLDIKGVYPFRRGRFTISGLPVPVRGGNKDEVIRLEAGATANMYFDFWPLIEEAKKRQADNGKSGAIYIRGSVLPAGRRACRSSWRKRWKILPEQRVLRRDETVTRELNAYRTLWSHLHRDPEKFGLVGAAWYSLIPELKGEISLAKVKEHLEPLLGPTHHIIAHDVYSALSEPE